MMDVSYTVGSTSFASYPNIMALEAELSEARARIALLEAEREILLKKIDEYEVKEAAEKNKSS